MIRPYVNTIPAAKSNGMWVKRMFLCEINRKKMMKRDERCDFKSTRDFGTLLAVFRGRKKSNNSDVE